LPPSAGEAGGDIVGTDSALQALVERFGDSPWLLILDNLEQVVGAARDLDELLARCPGVVILATSLMPLRLRAEREYPVPPLPLPPDPSLVPLDELASSPAVALFLDRARAARRDFALTEANAPAVVEIARRLESLPLAIELAAARTRLLDPDALLDRLAASLDALGTGAVDLPERQHTLRATVDWSLEMLDDAERSLLETTAVFVGGWTIEAAAEVAGLGEDRTLELTEALAAHSLINLDLTDRGPRPRMLDTMRAFVAERLAARPDVADIQRRHADHYRALAERADRPMRRGGQGGWVERLQAEAGNVATAVQWYLAHDRAPLPHLLRMLTLVWMSRDPMGDVRSSWVRELLPVADFLDLQARAELLWTATVTALEMGDDAPALAAGERLAPLVDRIDDPYLRALSHLAMAWMSPITGDIDGALGEAVVSLDTLRARDEPLWETLALVTVGTLETAVGRYGEATRHLTDVRDRAERFDSARLNAWSRVQLGGLAVLRRGLDDAWALLEEALTRSLAADSTSLVTLCLGAFAHVAFAKGDPERAALLAGAADGLRRRAGVRTWPILRRTQDEVLAQFRQALGTDRFDELFALGSSLNQHDAVGVVRDRRGAGAPVR
jgi:predicted ATPase